MSTLRQVFNGGKITEARELRDISMIRLAERIGVTRQTIAAYEANRQSPKPETVLRLAKELDVKMEYFKLPSREERVKPVFFRSLSSATQRARQSASRRLDCLQEAVSIIQGCIGLPPVNLPDFSLQDPLALSDFGIDALAEQTRRFLGVDNGPIPNLISLLEANGVIIGAAEFEQTSFDAFSTWEVEGDGERPFIFMSTTKHCCVRSRFDLAHELGHLILHRYIPKTRFSQRNDFKAIEHQADRFAGAFLLPEQSFKKSLFAPTLEFYASIKSHWRVSIAAMIYRSYQVGLIEKYEYDNLWMYYSKKRWRGNEPLDDVLPMEQPRFIRRAVELLVESGEMSKHDLLALLPYPAPFIDSLIGTNGFFSAPIESDDLSHLPKITSTKFDQHGFPKIITLGPTSRQ